MKGREDCIPELYLGKGRLFKGREDYDGKKGRGYCTNRKEMEGKTVLKGKNEGKQN